MLPWPCEKVAVFMPPQSPSALSEAQCAKVHVDTAAIRCDAWRAASVAVLGERSCTHDDVIAHDDAIAHALDTRGTPHSASVLPQTRIESCAAAAMVFRKAVFLGYSQRINVSHVVPVPRVRALTCCCSAHRLENSTNAKRKTAPTPRLSAPARTLLLLYWRLRENVHKAVHCIDCSVRCQPECTSIISSMT